MPEHQSSSSFTKKNNQLKQSGQSARTAYYFNGLLIFAYSNGLIPFGFAPIFPDICYHLTHYKPAAADIPV
ncbi:hypothetical protein MZE03_27850, partial [Escherichia coli]|nr:hypothetical protein [Escherichia coli]MCK2433709.1 hypothetical protein [Escherichia coli]